MKLTPIVNGFTIGDVVRLTQDDQDHGLWRLVGMHTDRIYTRSIRYIDDLHELALQAVEAEQAAMR